MSGCIYLITCLENGKKYIGQHNKPDPKQRWADHKRSPTKYPLHSALKKYGSDRFTWEVLISCPHEKLTVMEGYYAEVFGSYVWDSPGGYNAAWCSVTPTLGLKHTLETKEKCGKADIGRKASAETKEKLRQIHLGRKASPETKEKMRLISLKRSPEAIEKMQKARIGMKVSTETIEKLRQSHLGKKQTPETIEKRRQANLGRKQTPETIEKRRQTNLDRKASRQL